MKVKGKECSQMYGTYRGDVVFCRLNDRICLLEVSKPCTNQEEEEREEAKV
jgi:hypothetical protein